MCDNITGPTDTRCFRNLGDFGNITDILTNAGLGAQNCEIGLEHCDDGEPTSCLVTPSSLDLAYDQTGSCSAEDLNSACNTTDFTDTEQGEFAAVEICDVLNNLGNE